MYNRKAGMVFAVILGVVIGLVSTIPFFIAAKRARYINATSGSLSVLGPFLLTVVLSFIVLAIGVLACKFLAENVVLPFSIAELVSFLVGVLGFAIFVVTNNKKREKE